MKIECTQEDLKGDSTMMRASYRWGWQIANDGFTALSAAQFTDNERNKAQYVNEYLDASVNKANCGWYGVSYCVCEIDEECRTEFVLMFGDKETTPNGARWINVTGNSKGAIAEAVWSLVFA